MQDELVKKAIEIANILFASEEKYLSKEDLNNLIGEDLKEHTNIITQGLQQTKKIKGKPKAGGIMFVKGRGLHAKLSKNDENTLKFYINTIYNKPKNNKPEMEVQNAFETWLRETTIDLQPICNFRSNGRKADKWKNVDGYQIIIEELNYNISFKPILTTFEVKPCIPDVEGISQARNYLSFSHHVYLVFEDKRSREEIMRDLHKGSFNDSDGIGVYVTRDRNSEVFEKIQNSNSKPPTELEVEKALDNLLNDEDKKPLRQRRKNYLKEHVFKQSLD